MQGKVTAYNYSSGNILNLFLCAFGYPSSSNGELPSVFVIENCEVVATLNAVLLLPPSSMSIAV